MQIRACELYYDSEASYRAVSRQLGITPYRIFKIITALGANCKSTVDMAADFSSLAGYYTVPDAIKLINAFEKFNFKWAKDVVSPSNIDAI
jgi:L-alanine-DL-glutamate epimerase-like enolase superfamily enzyme